MKKLLTFIIDLFVIIFTKKQPDHCTDQIVKQIQLGNLFYITINEDVKLG